MMKQRKGLLITGIAGTIITLLCCATPVLVILLGVVGLGAMTGYLDYILFPILGFFIILTLYAYRKQKRSNPEESCCTPKKVKKEL
jgi:mercuric ion transport protein